MNRRLSLAGGLGLAIMGSSMTGAYAQSAPSARGVLADQMAITQRLGEFVAKDARFTTSEGAPIAFGDLLGQRPVLVVPVFFKCTRGCQLIEENVIKVLAKLDKGDLLRVGRDLDVAFVSIDPREDAAVAAVSKSLFMEHFAQPDTAQGWHLLVGDHANIQKFTDSIGFKFHTDAQGNINHPIGTVLISPKGKIAAYTIGDNVPTVVLEDSLKLAAQEQVAEPADQSTMYGCITPVESPYRGIIQLALQITGTLTVIAFLAGIYFMNRKPRGKSSAGGPQAV